MDNAAKLQIVALKPQHARALQDLQVPQQSLVTHCRVLGVDFTARARQTNQPQSSVIKHA